MDTFRIGDRRVGDGERVFVVAEIGLNHQGRRDLALELVARAAEAGADAVKFQKRSLSDLYDPDLLAHPERHERPYQYLLPILKSTELSAADYEVLVAECRRRGLLFLCTPWDRPSADFVDALGVPAFKIASTDCTNHELLDHVAAKGKPILLSTGAATLDDVGAAVGRLRRGGVPFALLHCNCTYPAAPADIHLRNLDTLRRFGAPVGYSGHERGTAVAVAAAALGACVIEKHLTLDASMPGPDHRASLEPAEFRRLVEDVRTVEAALGSRERRITQGEVLNREVLGKSVIAAAPIRAGDTIERRMLAVRGPGKGLSPRRLDELVGRSAPRDLAAGERFRDEDLAPAAAETLRERPVGNWGVIVRVGDGALARAHRAPVQEFHLTPADLDRRCDPPRRTESRLVVHAPEYADEGFMDPASLDERVRQRSLELLRRVIRFTRRIAPSFAGAPAIVIHPGGMSLEPLGRDERRVQLERFGESLRALEHDGIDLLPENLPPYPWYFGGQWVSNVFTEAEEIRAFLEREELGLCLDVSHAQLACNAAGERLEDFVERLVPYVRHLHLSDARGLNGEGLQIGEGEIDFAAVFARLRGYRGTWVPEIWRGHQNDGAGFVTALNRLAPMMKGFPVQSS